VLSYAPQVALTLAKRAFLVGALAAILGAGAILFAQPRAASAHPLGNFTINLYAHVQLTVDDARVRYVVDIAEIPAFQEFGTIDTDGDGTVSDAESATYLDTLSARVRDDLHLQIEGERVNLEAVTSELSFPAGQGGLDTQRVVIDYAGPMPDGWQDDAPLSVEFRDGNYAERIGWHEVIVTSLDGVSIVDANVPSQDASAELTAYPEAELQDPLNVSSATFSFEPGPGTGAAPLATTAAAAAEEGSRGGDRFTSLVSEDEVTVPFLMGAMLIAAGFGALHALGPGHGKTVVAAYLVGERGTARHAVALGLMVTATHTVSVFALGLITLYASQFIVPERLYPWLSLASGLIVVTLGGGLLISRLRSVRGQRSAVGRQPRTAVGAPVPALAFAGGGVATTPNGGWMVGGGAHEGGSRATPAAQTEASAAGGHAHANGQKHGHSHVKEHGHSHAVPGADGSPVTWRSLLALGVSGGIVPCPSALVVLLGAISLHRVGLGLLLVVAFSVGLAVVLTSIGLVLVWAKGAMSRSRLLAEGGRLRRVAFAPLAVASLPTVSALAITLVGVFMTVRAMMGETGSGFGLL
jgi:ABC-type nickel/cobalt efflux system permease component RcnA